MSPSAPLPFLERTLEAVAERNYVYIRCILILVVASYFEVLTARWNQPGSRQKEFIGRVPDEGEIIVANAPFPSSHCLILQELW